MAAETSIQHPNIRLISSPLPEQSSLRCILQKSFANGMNEDAIAIILKEILKGLSYLHDQHLIGHKNVNARQIYVSCDAGNNRISVELTVNRATDCLMPKLSFEIAAHPTEGIWDLGILALELGYGSLPGDSTPEKLATLAANVLKIRKAHLEIEADDHQDEGKAKGKGKEAINLEKGEGEGKEAINLEKREGEGEEAINLEKGEDKGEKPINQEKTADPSNQEEGKGKGKEPIQQEETEELGMIKMPPQLENLLDDEFVKGFEEKVLTEKKKEAEKRAKEKKKKQNKYVRAIKEKYNEAKKYVKEKILKIKDDRKTFSRDFLEVVMRCLDQENKSTATQIMQLKFFNR